MRIVRLMPTKHHATYANGSVKTESVETPQQRIVLTWQAHCGWSVHTVRTGTHDISNTRDFKGDEAAARKYANSLFKLYNLSEDTWAARPYN